jgi:hypothetical protein
VLLREHVAPMGLMEFRCMADAINITRLRRSKRQTITRSEIYWIIGTKQLSS